MHAGAPETHHAVGAAGTAGDFPKVAAAGTAQDATRNATAPTASHRAAIAAQGEQEWRPPFAPPSARSRAPSTSTKVVRVFMHRDKRVSYFAMTEGCLFSLPPAIVRRVGRAVGFKLAPATF